MDDSKAYLLVYNHRSDQRREGKLLMLIYKILEYEEQRADGEIIWARDRDEEGCAETCLNPIESDGDRWMSREEFAKFQADNIELFL